MKSKKLIGFVGVAMVIVVGLGIHHKNKIKNEAKEKYLNEESKKIELTEEQKKRYSISKSAGADKWEDKYDQSKDNYFDFSKEEVVKTRDMGVEFLKYVRPYVYDKGISNETANNIKKLTTKGLGDELTDRLKHLRPAICVGFRKMEINELEPVQYKKFEDGTVEWQYVVLENAINNNNVVGKKMYYRISLLFVKEKDDWKIGDYLILSQYENNYEEEK